MIKKLATIGVAIGLLVTSALPALAETTNVRETITCTGPGPFSDLTHFTQAQVSFIDSTGGLWFLQIVCFDFLRQDTIMTSLPTNGTWHLTLMVNGVVCLEKDGTDFPIVGQCSVGSNGVSFNLTRGGTGPPPDGN